MTKLIDGLKIMNTVENLQDYFRWLVFLPPKDDFIKLRNGIKYKIRKDDSDRWVVGEVWAHRIYSADGFEIREDDTIIDIGAHIGVFSVFAGSQAKKGRIIAFEPFRESYEILRENLLLNNIRNTITANLGVAGKRKKCRIYFDKRNSSCNSTCIKSDNSAEIRCITLEDIFRDYKIERCNYLKIDCEGSEYDILFNTPDRIFERIDKIALEYHDDFIESEYTYKDLRELLEKKGFAVTLKPIRMMYAVKKITESP